MYHKQIIARIAMLVGFLVSFPAFGQVIEYCYVDQDIDCADATYLIYMENEGAFNISCGGCSTFEDEGNSYLFCDRHGQEARIANISESIPFAGAYPGSSTGNVSGKISFSDNGTKDCGVVVDCLEGCYINSIGQVVCEHDPIAPYPLPRRFANGTNCLAELHQLP